jgi:type III secretory pathway component EscS
VMFHLDYISCFLTVLAPILLARKSWIGLLVAIVNSLTVCVIGLQTSQLGFIPANLFCICVYAFSMRPWLKEQTHANRDQVRRQESLVIPLNVRLNRAAVVTNTKSILSPEVNICNKDRTSGVTPCVLT